MAGRAPMKRLGGAAAVAVAGLMVLPTGAGAVAVTLGATDLSPVSQSLNCPASGIGGGCVSLTLSQTALPEPGTMLVAPGDGVITGWHVRGSTAGAGDARLRVLRPAGGGQFTGAGTSTPATVLDASSAN